MKLSQLKNIIKESIKGLMNEQGGLGSSTHFTANIICGNGFYPLITNPHPGTATAVGPPAGPHASYSRAIGDEICFTCVPVPPVDPDRAPMGRSMG